MNIKGVNDLNSNVAAGLAKHLRRREGRYKKKKHGDAFQKEHSFVLRSDSIVERGWEFGCRLHYNRNNERML